jgi:polysaccharide biosynthesis/export protein
MTGGLCDDCGSGGPCGLGGRIAGRLANGKEIPLRSSSDPISASDLKVAGRSTVLGGFGKIAALVGALAFGSGCEVKSFLDQSELVDPKPGQHLIVPIVSYLDAHEEQSDEVYPMAVDPTPDDLIPSTGDYHIGPDDQLTITIGELLGPGTETVKVVRVQESGRISLPYLYNVHAGGLTEGQLEQEIASAYKDASLIATAQVSVSVTEALNRTFTIKGAVTNPGEYAINRADFRLIEALSTAREPTSQIGIDTIYIIRKAQPGDTTQPSGLEPAATQPTSPDILAPHSEGPQPPTKALMMMADPDTQPANPDATPTTQPSGDQTTEGRFVVVNGKAQPADMSEGTPTTAPAEAAPGTPTTDTGATPASAEQFRFADLKPPTNIRVIRVPFDRLKRGELQFNLVIRPGDVIDVPYPLLGTFNIGGHVARVGSYNLSPKNTVKDAIIAAGMLDQVGVPERSQIIRRLPGDRQLFARINVEKIFVGEAPDVYLKPNDEILVGTNALAPFLAAIRNGFRITYGFGFLYDRNYWNPSNNGNGNGNSSG